MPSLAVFLTVNRGLWDWERTGSLSREMAIYKDLAEAGWTIHLYTYDRTLKIPQIGFDAEIHPQWPYIFPRQFSCCYQRLLPRRFSQLGKKTDIIITNQAHGSGPAVPAARLWKSKLVARCGYVYGEAAEALGLSGQGVKEKIRIERETFTRANLCMVPTNELKKWICDHYGIPPTAVLVLPNYVDTDWFRPDPSKEAAFDIISVGRLSPTKRPQLLLEAFAGTGIRIQMIGDGEMKPQLTGYASEKKMQVQFTSRVAHHELPALLNRARIYVNISKWEGHPKSMLEAMACGNACIGARSPGISNLLLDGQTGLLVEPQAGNLRDAVERLLHDAELRMKLSRNAREYALKNFSHDVIFPEYRIALEQLLQG
jgi:glycosyltransferase involved in cell wall biosynthesis